MTIETSIAREMTESELIDAARVITFEFSPVTSLATALTALIAVEQESRMAAEFARDYSSKRFFENNNREIRILQAEIRRRIHSN